jgi:hypothetical protein
VAGYPTTKSSLFEVPLWKMNGSQVKIAIANGSWTISIEEPNPALQRAGVRRGTVLFRGTQNGEMVSGTAFAFSANCQPVPVTTSGKISNNRVFELRGSAQAVRDLAACLHKMRSALNSRSNLIEG